MKHNNGFSIQRFVKLGFGSDGRSKYIPQTINKRTVTGIAHRKTTTWLLDNATGVDSSSGRVSIESGRDT